MTNGLSKSDRRTFMRRGAMGAGAVWMLSLEELAARSGHSNKPVINGISPYGPISPKKDETTGLELLKLPDGFRYSSYSWTGDTLTDGAICPNLHDGMAVVDEWTGHDDDDDDDDRWRGDDGHDDDNRGHRSGRLVLVRNHEGGAGAPYLSNRPDITYNPHGFATGNGGTTNLLFDARQGKWLESWATLAGTVRNCAGGVSPWGTWVTCEETGDGGHGWNFEVWPEKGDTTPLTDMGRFSHEAVMIDPRTGYVYETEDSGNSGLYKFVPYRRARLDRGGRLYMLAVRNQPNLNLSAAYPIGTRWDVKWVRIDDPTAATQSCYAQGAAKGGARFSRLEGCLVGRQDGLLPDDQRRRRRRRTGLRVRPARRNGDAHLRRAERDRRRQSRQHHRDAAWRAPSVRGRRRKQLHRGRAPGRPHAPRQDVHVRDEQHQPDRSLQRQGSGGQLHAERMGRRLLQPRRPLAVREHSDARRDVRHHRTVGEGAALTQVQVLGF